MRMRPICCQICQALEVNVTSSGRTYPMPLIDASLSETRAIMEANVIAPLAMVQAFMPLLVASGEGLVINISSPSDRAPFPFKGVYAMSKAALSAFSRTLSLELHYLDVRVMTVVTGFVTSQLGRRPEDPDQPPLPEGSLYTSMSNSLIRRGGSRMPADLYAEQVVKEALKGKGWEIGPWSLWGRKEWLYIGAQINQVRFVTSLGERFAKWVMMRIWGLGRLSKQFKGKKD